MAKLEADVSFYTEIKLKVNEETYKIWCKVNDAGSLIDLMWDIEAGWPFGKLIVALTGVGDEVKRKREHTI